MPIPLMPCSAFKVTEMRAVTTPITSPVPVPARIPKSRLPVRRAVK